MTSVLITVTGPDRPGVSSVLFAALTRVAAHSGEREHHTGEFDGPEKHGRYHEERD